MRRNRTGEAGLDGQLFAGQAPLRGIGAIPRKGDTGGGVGLVDDGEPLHSQPDSSDRLASALEKLLDKKKKKKKKAPLDEEVSHSGSSSSGEELAPQSRSMNGIIAPTERRHTGQSRLSNFPTISCATIYSFRNSFDPQNDQSTL